MQKYAGLSDAMLVQEAVKFRVLGDEFAGYGEEGSSRGEVSVHLTRCLDLI